MDLCRDMVASEGLQPANRPKENDASASIFAYLNRRLATIQLSLSIPICFSSRLIFAVTGKHSETPIFVSSQR